MRNALYLSIMASLVLIGCNQGKATSPYSVALDGSPKRGKELIRQYGCGACHIIPGIRDAHGLVGPPLLYFSQRTMIAGELPNSPPNLIQWIEHPRDVEPKTAMPDLGLTKEQATDIAAFLYTLRGPEGARWIE